MSTLHTPHGLGATTRTPLPERTPDHTHDVVVVGGGTGGYATALRAAQLGKEVALVERDLVGGTCLHRGCIPTKALLQSAEAAEWAHAAPEFGIHVTFDGVEVAAVNAHRDRVVDKMHRGLQGALKHRGVETVMGTGTLQSSDTVAVATADGHRTLRAPCIVLATGSRPRGLPGTPFDGHRILSSDHALQLEELPASAIVLGSGAVGMEFATAWDAFGVTVTVVEMEDRVLPLEDPTMSRELERAFRKRGIDVHTRSRVTEATVGDDGVTCTVVGADTEASITADLLLVAIGREPVTDDLGLDAVGVAVDRGSIVVDEWCRTSVPGVFAVGDVIPTLGLAHASFGEGMLVADQIGGIETCRPIDYLGVPRVTYSHPEVASVGYSEAAAEAAGYEVVTTSYPFQALGRAAMARATGMVKLVAEKDAAADGGVGRVLGVHVIGPRATDLIGEGQLIYNWDALPSDVAELIHAHPSFSEAIGEAHLALAGRALHG